MQLTQSRLRKINIYTGNTTDSGYVGRKTVPSLVGFVYAEVFPEKESLSSQRSGKRVSTGSTLILRKDAGVKCGDFAGIISDSPDSRVVEILRFPNHITARTEPIR